MAMIVELGPKLLLEYNKDESPRKKALLRSGGVANLFRRHGVSLTIYLATGGPMGDELEKVLIDQKFQVERISVRDDAPVEASLVMDHRTYRGHAPEHKLTFKDVQSIKKNFYATLYGEKVFLLPIFDLEKEFAAEFITRSKEYYRRSVIFGENALEFAKYDPNYIIVTREQVEEMAPFRVTSDAELNLYAHSFVDEKQTRLLILDRYSMFFLKENTSYVFDVNQTNMDRTLFSVLFALQSEYPQEKLMQFIVGANMATDNATIGEMAEIGKTVTARVLHP
ncbi:MAG: hypothetical protein Q4Q17_03775 [Tissierellia bacterium]|nr:hypothetical protein [Tissierellia bacterium]